MRGWLNRILARQQDAERQPKQHRELRRLHFSEPLDWINDRPATLSILDMIHIAAEDLDKVRAPTTLTIDQDDILRNCEIVGRVCSLDDPRGAPVGLKHAIGEMKVSGLSPKPLLKLVADPEGPHCLGGPIPDGFRPAKTAFENDTQYIGTLATGAGLNLEHPLHLSVPLYDEFTEIVLDYSDPMAPVPADPAALNSSYIHSAYGAYPEARTAEFEPHRFSVAPIDRPESGSNDGFGLAGVPVFEQEPSQPISPRTGKPIPFLCQIFTLNQVKLSKAAQQRMDNPHLDYISHLHFWSDGSLFLYWEPETRLLGIVIQNT